MSIVNCSCGGCGCSNCTPAPCCTVQLPDTEPVEYTFENANLAGVGVLAGVDGTNVQFRGIVSESLALTITLNAPNNTIEIDFDDALLIADIPTASETERGIAEIATQAETNAGIVDNVIVSPAKLAGRTATETMAGIAEIATQAEVNTGTNDTNFVTPLKLATFGGAQLSTTTFADAVARGAKVAAFAGQFGGQIDTGQAFIAGSTAAGDWNGVFTFGGTSLMTGGTSLNLNGNALLFLGGSLNLDGTTTNTWSGNTTIDNAVWVFDNVSTLDFAVDTVFEIAGNPLANESFIGVDTGGSVAEFLISDFLSNYNTTNYGIPSGTLARTTFTTYNGQTVSNPPTQAEVQIIDDALKIVSQRLAALITDLIVTSKPTA